MTTAAIGTTPAAAPRSRRATIASWIVTGIAVLFLTFDIVIKLVLSPEAIQATGDLGYPAGLVRPIALIELACLALYLIPRTAPLGAVLWTGYLGGAVATHVRVENPLFSHILFPTYVAALLWLGLWLRDRRVRNLLSPR